MNVDRKADNDATGEYRSGSTIFLPNLVIPGCPFCALSFLFDDGGNGEGDDDLMLLI